MQRLIEAKPLIVYGNGNQTRDFVHVNDICQAIHLCMIDATRPLKENNGGETFQIASSTETSINELLVLLRAISNKDFSVVHKPERKGEIIRNYSDITKARSLLNFSPQIELKQDKHLDLRHRYTYLLMAVF